MPLLTNAQAAMLFIDSINALTMEDLAVDSYAEYFTDGIQPNSQQMLDLK